MWKNWARGLFLAALVCVLCGMSAGQGQNQGLTVMKEEKPPASSSQQVSSEQAYSSEAGSSDSVSSAEEESSQPEESSSQEPEEQKSMEQIQEEVKEQVDKVATEDEKREDPEAGKQHQEEPPMEDTVVIPPEPERPPATSSEIPLSSLPSSDTPVSSDMGASSSPEEDIPSEGSGSESSSNVSSGSSSELPEVPVNGWYTLGGQKYLNIGGVPVKGWQTVEGRKYKFNSSTGALESKTGIDVSEFQGNINWQAVKNDGIDFVMLRVGFRFWGKNHAPDDYMRRDAKFTQNYQGAKAAGLKVGVYFFSQSITVEEALEEAAFTLEAIKGLDIDGPVAYDIEGTSDPAGRTNDPSITNALRTEMTKAFCNEVARNGYQPQVCTYVNYAYTKLNMGELTMFPTWIAHYGVSGVTNYKYPFQMWQYTSAGSVKGISGSVDLDVMV